MTMSVTTGAVGQWRSVAEMLREIHEHETASVREVIARRKKNNAPLDDAADWQADFKQALGHAVLAKDRDDAKKALVVAQAIVFGAIEEPPPYEPNPAHAGFKLRIRALSKGDVINAQMRMNAAGDGVDTKTTQGKLERHARMMAAQREFLLLALAGVRACLEDIDIDAGADEVASAIEQLDTAGFIGDAYSCAMRYQDLDPLQRRGFGSQRPLTSATSAAASAQHLDVSPGAATSTASASGAGAPSTRPDAVLNGTS